MSELNGTPLVSLIQDNDAAIARRWLFSREHALYNERAELLEQRDRLVEEVRRVQLAIDAIDARRSPGLGLLEEMRDVPEPVEAPAPERRRHRKKARPTERTRRVDEEVRLALEAAGDAGLSSRELSQVARLPIGTAGARLSIAKQKGLVRHDVEAHRYIIVHSAPQDNNQGPTTDAG